jgi:hypothetical protein
MNEKKAASTALILLFVFFLGFSLTVNLKTVQGHFLFADEAIYFALTTSLAEDGDIEYTKQDLIRYYKNFPSGPLGIFLKEGKDNRIFFAKSFAYPLFAAPFVRLFGVNGFLVFHALLFSLLLLMGVKYLSLGNRPLISLAWVLTFLFASVAIVYAVWLMPDFFNLFLAFAVLFLWLYKHRKPVQAPGGEGPLSRTDRFLLSPWSDYLAAFLAGIAVFAKPPSLALMGPIVLFYLLKKRFMRTAVLLLIFVVTAGLFFGANHLVTGDWNYQGGKRKSFYGDGGYPLEKAHLTFDSAKGDLMTAEGYTEKHLLPAKFVFYNILYFFVGRFTGTAWYFFPALLCLGLFFARRKQLFQWLIFAALAGEILIWIAMMPDNYAGGGGALANRYFLSVYPLFFFLPDLHKKTWEIGLSWIWAAIFIAPILVSPFFHSHYPATHVKRLPYKLLPLEMTLVNNYPTNTNPYAFRQEVGTPPDIGWLHFLDDNFLPRLPQLNERGFWTRGRGRAEMVLKTYYPVKKLTFRLLNSRRMNNTAWVRVGGRKQSVTLGAKQWGTLIFDSPKPFNIKSLFIYRITVRSQKDAIPHFEVEGSDERRHLGIYFEVDILPEGK